MNLKIKTKESLKSVSSKDVLNEKANFIFNYKENQSNYKIIFTLNSLPDVYIFPKNNYIYENLSDYIDEDNYNAIISIASKQMQKSFSSKRQHDILVTPLINKIIGGLSIIFIISYLACMMLAQQNLNGEFLFRLSIFFITCGLSLTVFMSFYNFCRPNKKYMSLDDFFELGMNNLFEEINLEVDYSNYPLEYNDKVANKIYNQKLLNIKSHQGFNLANITNNLKETIQGITNTSNTKLFLNKGLEKLDFKNIKCYFVYSVKDKSIEIYIKKEEEKDKKSESNNIKSINNSENSIISKSESNSKSNSKSFSESYSKTDHNIDEKIKEGKFSEIIHKHQLSNIETKSKWDLHDNPNESLDDKNQMPITIFRKDD